MSLQPPMNVPSFRFTHPQAKTMPTNIPHTVVERAPSLAKMAHPRVPLQYFAPVQFHGKFDPKTFFTIIDISNIDTMGDAEKKALGLKMLNGFEKQRAVLIKGHGIPASTWKALYHSAEGMMGRSREELAPFIRPDYAMTGLQTDAGFSVDTKDAAVDPKRLVWKWRAENKGNVPPTQLDQHFGPNMDTVFSGLYGIGVSLLDALDHAIDSPKTNGQGYLKSMVYDPTGRQNFSTLWLNSYPGAEPEDHEAHEGDVIGREHKDTALFTLLPPASLPGIQVQQPDGTWKDAAVSIDDNLLIAFPSGLMPKLTKDLIPTNVHQVVRSEDLTTRRNSLTLFVLPLKEGDHDNILRNIDGEKVDEQYSDRTEPAFRCMDATSSFQRQPGGPRGFSRETFAQYNPALQ